MWMVAAFLLTAMLVTARGGSLVIAIAAGWVSVAFTWAGFRWLFNAERRLHLALAFWGLSVAEGRGWLSEFYRIVGNVFSPLVPDDTSTPDVFMTLFGEVGDNDDDALWGPGDMV